jgi:hypothetical protein
MNKIPPPEFPLQTSRGARAISTAHFTFEPREAAGTSITVMFSSLRKIFSLQTKFLFVHHLVIRKIKSDIFLTAFFLDL